jgi:hypothetical protein
MKSLKVFGVLLLTAACAFAQNFPGASGNPSVLSRPGGTFYAASFNWNARVIAGNSCAVTTGTNTCSAGATSGTVVIAGNSSGGAGGVQLADGTTLSFSTIAMNLMPLIFDWGQGNQETVTPTTLTVGTCPAGNLGVGGSQQCLSFTGSFLYTHGQSAVVVDGTYGLQSAINSAALTGVGGEVTIDGTWIQMGGSDVLIRGAIPYPGVYIKDGTGPLQFWNMTPGLSLFAAPGALTSSTAFSSLTVAGSASFTAATIHVAYTPVDCMGNEGPQSADYSFTATATKAIQFTAPAAITGACGWIPYIGLMSGSSTNEYQVQLYTQPTVIGAVPVSSAVCTLSPVLLAVGKYACAITNATYNQTGSGAVVPTYPVVTSPQGVQLGLISTASYYQANSVGRTTYAYAPGSTPGIPGVVKVITTPTIATAAASTVPQPLGMVELPAGFMNYVGRSIELCGFVYSSTQGASTVVQIAFEWDAQGSDVTTGLPVLIGGPAVSGTLTTGTTGQFDFCQDFTTTVASASATGGSILAGHGYMMECALTTCATPFFNPNMTVAAVGSLNLAGPARIQVIMVQTTSSSAVPKLMNLSVKVLN